MAQFTIDKDGVLTKVTLDVGETSVTLPNNVDFIAPKVFTKEIGIVELHTNAGCKILPGAFYGNSTIRSLYLAQGAEVYGGAFAFCNTVESISVGSASRMRVENGLLIESEYVVLCTNIEEVVIPEGVTEIGEYAFSGCYNLRRVTFPSTLTTIGQYAFCDCIGLKELTIPRKVSEIGRGAFYGCSNVDTIRIDDGAVGISTTLEIIEDQFANNFGLKVVKIPAYVNKIHDGIGDNSFHNDNVLEQCIIEGANYRPAVGRLPRARTYPNGTAPIALNFNADGGMVSPISKSVYIGSPYGILPTPYGKKGHSFTGWYLNDEKVTETTICWNTESHTLVARWTILDFTVVFHSHDGSAYETKTVPFGTEISVPEIPPAHEGGAENYNFIGWLDVGGTMIDSSIPIRVEEDTDYYPKYQAVNYWQASISGDDATILGIDPEITSDEVEYPIVIPKQIFYGGRTYAVKAIGDAAFSKWIAQGEYYEPDFRVYGDVEIEEGIESIGSNAFRGTDIGRIVIPSTCKTIGDYAFFDCSNLRCINSGWDDHYIYDWVYDWIIPEGVEKIGHYAFAHNSESDYFLDLPRTLKTLGNNAFQNTGIKYLNFDRECLVRTIPYRCFYESSISRINGLPDGLEEIGDAAFMSNPLDEHGTLSIPENVTKIGSAAFRYCQGLIGVDRPNNLEVPKLIDIGWAAFYGCFAGGSDYAYVNLGHVGTIGAEAFSACYAIKELSVASVVNILDYALWNCSGLASPPSITDDTKHIGKLALYELPEEVYEGYLDYEVWDDEKQKYKYIPAIDGFDIYQGWLCASKKWRLDGKSTADIRQWDNGTPTELRGIASGVFDGSNITSIYGVFLPGSTATYDMGCRVCRNAFSNYSHRLDVYLGAGKYVFAEGAFEGISTLSLHFSGIYAHVFEGSTFIEVPTLNLYFDSQEAWDAVSYSGEINEGYGYNLYIAGHLVLNIVLNRDVSDYAYRGNTSIIGVTVNAGCGRIGKEAFSGCTGILTLTINNQSVVIDQEAFKGCTSLVSPIELYSGMKVGERAFKDCTGISEISFPDYDYRHYPDVNFDAFEGCDQALFETITLRANYTTLMTYTRVGQRMITAATLHVGPFYVEALYVTNAGQTIPSTAKPRHFLSRNLTLDGAASSISIWNAYVYSGSATNGRLPLFDLTALLNIKSLTHISIFGFEELCVDWKRVDLERSEELTLSHRGLIDDAEMSVLKYSNINAEGGEESWGFSNGLCVQVDSIDRWCESSFDETSNPLRLGHRLLWRHYYQEYEDDEDSYTSELVEDYLELTQNRWCLGKRFRRVNDRAFDGCTSFKRVTIGDNIETMGRDVFRNCAPDIFDRTSKPGLVLVDGWVVDYDPSSEPDWNGGRIEYDLTGIRGVCDYAFAKASDVVYLVNIPRDIHGSQDSAFNTVGLVDTLTAPGVGIIGNRVRFATLPLEPIIVIPYCRGIDAGVFEDNDTLESITVESGRVDVDDDAFKGCINLTEVNFVDGAGCIGEQAFDGCISLVTAPSITGTIGEYAFRNCYNLPSIDIESLGEHGSELVNRFVGCTALKTISIPGFDKNLYVDMDICGVFGEQVENISFVVDEVAEINFVEAMLDGLIEIKTLHIGEGIESVMFLTNDGIGLWRGDNASQELLDALYKKLEEENVGWYELDSWLLFIADNTEEINLERATFKGIAHGAICECHGVTNIKFPASLQHLSYGALGDDYSGIGLDTLNHVEFMGNAPTILECFWYYNLSLNMFSHALNVKVFVGRSSSGWGANPREVGAKYDIVAVATSGGGERFNRSPAKDVEDAAFPIAWVWSVNNITRYYTESKTPKVGDVMWSNSNGTGNSKTIRLVFDSGPYWCDRPLYYRGGN